MQAPACTLSIKEHSVKSSMLTLLFAACLTANAAAATNNPLLRPSKLPLQFPPFNKIKTAHFLPAFEAGMKEQKKEIEAIVKNSAAPTFENTLVAMERSGKTLIRVERVFGNLNSSDTNDELQKIETEIMPRLAAHQDEISLNPALFARIKSVYDKRDSLNLDPESAQLLNRYYKQFVRSGALLSDEGKTRLKAINQQLASLMTEFDQRIRKGAKAAAVTVDNVAELDGLSPEQIGSAAEAAKERGLNGKWVITLQNTTRQPVFAQMKNRALRERIFRASIARGNSGGDSDNTALASQIASLRAEQAALLGYKNYAAYSLEDESASTPEAVNAMLSQLGAASLAKAKEEAAAIQQIIDSEAKTSNTEPFKLEPWDWEYYSAQVRAARYSYSDDEVKPYFEYERVLKDGVFYVAHELYGLSFKERKDLPVYHPDVRVFEVLNDSGKTIGILLRDDFKRDSKKGGAWMEFFVDSAGLFNQKPVITNNLNIPKPPKGQPVLMTFDEVTTMFHEFGHALHGFLSDVKYPTLAGTNVPADFVEYPSQQNEMWAREPAVLAHFAKDYRTGKPMPKELLAKIIASQTYGGGFDTAEYVEAAMLDQAWHQLSQAEVPQASGVMGYEAQALENAGMLYAPVPPRYRTTYFAHAFSGGYSAAYYAYIWSEVLARDTGKWFQTHGGLNRANGEFYRAKILSRGRTEEPDVLFQKFYGAKPDIGPLLEYRGIEPAAAQN